MHEALAGALDREIERRTPPSMSPLTGPRLWLRRESENDMAASLTGIYVRLRRTGLSEEQASKELLHLLESQTDSLSRMGIPPAWERAVVPDPNA
jgi:hypothetical protein